MQPDGSHACDNCGVDVSPGSLDKCIVTSDVHPDNKSMVQNYHHCRDREVDGEKVKGCHRKIIRPAVLKHFNEAREPRE